MINENEENKMPTNANPYGNKQRRGAAEGLLKNIKINKDVSDEQSLSEEVSKTENELSKNR